jgi:hypothetical protein
MPTKQTFTAGQVLTAQQLNDLQDYIGVVQVKSATKTDTFTTTSSTYTDITSLSVSITPTSASNKIFITCMVNFQGNDGSTTAQLRLMRDSTAIGLGAAAGNRTPGTAAMISLNNVQLVPGHLSFLDSPAVATATTYKVQIRSDVSGQTVFVNRTPLDTDSANFIRAISTITVMEVTP